MIKIIGVTSLVLICILGISLLSQSKNPLKYSYLFRNTILSESQKYELAPVLRGRIYYPRYFYIPSLKQYLVYSEADFTGSWRFHKVGEGPKGKTYTILDEDGLTIRSFETPLNFSHKSGCFYSPSSYIPWVETGTTDSVAYDTVYNQDLSLNRKEFYTLFESLYENASYMEIVPLLSRFEDVFDSGVIFKSKGKTELLLTGRHNSHLFQNYTENLKTNRMNGEYELRINNKEDYPESKPLIEMHALETANINPFSFWRFGFNNPFRIENYHKEYASGWNGVAVIHGIPIYVPGDENGTAYVSFSINDDIFRFAVLDVNKSDYVPHYNLGLRTFQLPKQLRTDKSLTFVESAQNSGQNRLGGGVFVVRPNTSNNKPSNDLPTGITEEHFITLPINLQAALINPNSTTQLVIEDENITSWIPEIELLKNLTQLRFKTSISEIPDEISIFTKLEVLDMSYSKISRITPLLAELKELRKIDLYNNRLTEFPEVILKLKKLEHLEIGSNSILVLPSKIGDLSKLKYLSVILTDLTTLPSSMIDMEDLYIRDDESLSPHLPEEYQHLFEWKDL